MSQDAQKRGLSGVDISHHRHSHLFRAFRKIIEMEMEVKIEIRIVKVNERATDGKVRPVMSKPDRGMYIIKLQGPRP